MFQYCNRLNKYLKLLSFLVLLLIINKVINLEKAVHIQIHKKEEILGLRYESTKRSSQTVRKKENTTIKRKTFIENCPSYNYKTEELPPCPDKMRRRFPTALIAGVSKGGTTTLLRFLNAHPEIAARDGKLPENRYTAYFVQNEKTREWYRNLMPCSNADQITVERSPAYFNCNKCPRTISEFNSNMKLIFIFREPTDRAFSQYQMAKRTFIDRNRTFEESVLSTNLKQVKNNSFYIFVSRYQEHVKRWLHMFSLDQMLFLDGLTFVSSPSDVLNSVEDFLGIERFFTKDMFTRGRNGKFCLTMDDGDLKCPPSTKGLLHQSMKNSTRRTLEAYFKPLNTEFFLLINKRFEWGY